MTEATQQARENHHHDHAPAALNPRDMVGVRRVLPTRSVLAWPAWLRVAAVLPLVLALWLAVWWANEGAALW
ncbi:hypothetical protein [Rhodoferax sp.]|uniref:hypothetical protein n=1 Tax=Rhodoferax sp. TaxID=50421 RepID=UPI0025F05539|nr:hypothetical protein [Rhodoferax sp.]